MTTQLILYKLGLYKTISCTYIQLGILLLYLLYFVLVYFFILYSVQGLISL